ncbi:MAG: DEAD/DEAH box helicase family protein [Prolixibacteraceae bacterium]
MDFNELLKKYQSLQQENERLKEEIDSLKIQHSLENPHDKQNTSYEQVNEPLVLNLVSSQNKPSSPALNKNSESIEKIKLYKSLFRGRNDVYAKRWENNKKETAGYSPACANEWKSGICQKPKIPCSKCNNKDYLPFDEKLIDNHLRGRNNIVVGIYPLLLNETCYFLAIDFDDEGWQKDITTLREVCSQFSIPMAIEQSRSGNGAHAWFFFEQPLPASTARKFGSAMLTYSMSKWHEITFKSYDRLFPNQDTMPKGGFGNLIALPLQKAARLNNNSVFIDEHFQPFQDQWAFLSSIQKLSTEGVEIFTSKLCPGNELGTLKSDDEELPKPWETIKIKLQQNDFPIKIEIVKANMLFIPKVGISQKALNQLKRLAAFKNPEFYKAQAMRLTTFNKPRIIACADETAEYLCLPRGCETELEAFVRELNLDLKWVDKTNIGKFIKVKFIGTLRDDQPLALEKLMKHDNGVLCGTTAFGKTIAAIKLIAERKVNTLILVNKINLAAQWKEKIHEFLIIDETLPCPNQNEGKRNKKIRDIVGQLGGGKNDLNGIIDIAVMQSLCREGEVKELVKDYGMVIVDECHHVSAVSFELIMKSVNAKYVYGLTATPTRKDGHHPIITMQCGPIRFRDDAKKQAEKRPFDHYVIPRFTSFKLPLWWEKEEKDWSITELYAEVIQNAVRNQQIVADVIQCYKKGRNCLILTERTAHVEMLTTELLKTIPDVISIMGTMGAKETRETLTQITRAPIEKPLTLVATGRYIGEGFDEPRLDTLFLAMPISWKGTLQQYAGRLHRLFDGKKEVLIYDYVDIHVGMFEKMHNRRLAGYASIGYKAKGEGFVEEHVNIIFDKDNFLPVYSNDIISASAEIIIVSPFITKKRTLEMLKTLQLALDKNVKINVVTRPAEEYKGKDSLAWQKTIELLKSVGINIILKSNIHQKFAIIDQKLVWYGSINLLSYGGAQESIMRLESRNIAFELTRSITKQN